MSPRPPFTSPASRLRHRGPALLLARIESWDGRRVCCRGARRPWSWTALLEAAAQASGIACGLAEGGWTRGGVVAEYRDVDVRCDAWEGEVTLTAEVERRVLAFRRCRATVVARDGRTLLRAQITLVPDEAPS